MKFCPVVSEICHGQVHGPWKERKRIIIIIIIIIIIRNGAKTISLQTLFGRLNYSSIEGGDAITFKHQSNTLFTLQLAYHMDLKFYRD
jgi:hypothetical protein